MALEAAPAEGPPRTWTGRGINRAGATPSSHICQARPSPLRRRRARSSTASATAHSSSTASGSATAAACSLSRRRPWLSGALSIPRLHQHQARQRPATVGTTRKPRQDGGTLRPQARCSPAPPIRPLDAEVDSCGISPCGPVHAPSPPSRGYGRQPGLPMPSTCHGFSACRVRQVATCGRRPNAPGGSAGGLDLAGVRFCPGC